MDVAAVGDYYLTMPKLSLPKRYYGNNSSCTDKQSRLNKLGAVEYKVLHKVLSVQVNGT